MRGLMQRTPECALHLHVGMPDAETAIRVYNRLRELLPLLTGLSANSPWWHGRDSGLASARAAAVRAYPGRGIPPAFPDHAAYLGGPRASGFTPGERPRHGPQEGSDAEPDQPTDDRRRDLGTEPCRMRHDALP